MVPSFCHLRVILSVLAKPPKLAASAANFRQWGAAVANFRGLTNILNYNQMAKTGYLWLCLAKLYPKIGGKEKITANLGRPSV